MVKASSIIKCKACDSADLFWFANKTVPNGIQHNRLNTHDVQCSFVLGCNYCSETLVVVSADKIAELMNQQFSVEVGHEYWSEFQEACTRFARPAQSRNRRA